jgi:hypothetical protein
MKAPVLALIIVSGLISGTLKGGSPENVSAPGPYVEVRKDPNITIYSRWVPVTETLKTRQVKVVFNCKADPEDAVALLREDHSFLSWMNGTAAYSRIKTTDDRNWYCYVRYGLPWPLNDMDCILKYRIEDPGGGSDARVLVTGVPEFMKYNDGVTRIRNLQCEWIIRKTSPDSITVEYVQFSNQPSKFPRWIIDPIIQKSLIKSFNTFRGLLENNHTTKKTGK